MADQDERVKIIFETNAQETARATNTLGESIDNVEDSAKDASKSMRDLDKTFEEVYGDLKPLTTRMGEAEDRLYELSLAGKTATQEYRELLEVVANYRRTQIQTDQVVDAAATTLGQKLGGASQIAATGVQGVTAGMALFGDQSEDTEKALLKVQAAMAFADAISNISSLGGQFRVFQGIVKDTFVKIVAAKAAEKAATDAGTVSQLRQNLAVLANPYVIAAVALTALTVGIYAWVKSSDAAAKQEERTANAVKLGAIETENLKKSIEETSKATKEANDLEILRAKAYGATDGEIQKLIKSQKELSITQAGSQAKDAYDNLLRANSNAVAAVQTGNQDMIKSAEETQKEARALYERANEAFNQSIIESNKFELETKITNNAKLKDENEKAYKDRLDRLKKAEEARKALLLEEQTKEQQLFRAIQDANDKTEEEKLARQKERALEEIEILRKKGIDTADMTRLNEELFLTLENDLRAKRAEEKAEREKEEKEKQDKIDAEYLEKQTEALKKGVETQKNIDEYALEQKRVIKDKELDIADNAVKLASGLLGKSKGVQKAALIAESAVGIGKTVQGVFTGNAAALAQGITQAGPVAGPALATPAIVLNSVQGALSVAGNVAATAKALQALGGGGAPSAGGAGGAIASATPPAVAFNNTAENQIGQSIAGAQAEQPPIQVVVNESDITTAQNNVQVLVSENTFPG